MVQSSFNNASTGGPITASSKTTIDETYDLKGLNLVAPDQVMPAGETPFAINNRRFADNDDETSIAMRTRQGSTRLSTPVGETLNIANTGTITQDIPLTTAVQVAIPFTPSSTGVLTKFEATLKKSLNTRGYVIIEFYNDHIGLPNRLIATTSIAPSSITGSFTSVSSYLIDAPDVVASTQYWAVFKMQELGVGTYSLAGTATGSYATSINAGDTWVLATGSARFKTYVSTAGIVKGFTKRYPEDTDFLTLFAFGVDIYQMTDAGVSTVLDAAGVDVAADTVRFTNIDERTFWSQMGEKQLRVWDGTGAVADCPAVTTALGFPVNQIIFQNRLMTIPKDDQTRVEFSALYDFVTPYPVTNFFYIGRPKSPDWITAWHEFREGMTVFTKETKWTVLGSDIQTFQPTAHVGTKGAISQEATARGNEAIYFMADDRHIYAWNGSTDKQISFKVGPELKKILDLDKVRLTVYKNQLRVYYNRNPDANITHMLLYDIEQDQWFHDTGRPVLGSLEWVFDNNELVEVSSRAAAFYFGERTYSDLGRPIDFKYWTAYKLYGSSMSKKRIKRFRPIVRPADSAYYLKVSKDIDFQNRPNTRPYLVDAGGAKWGTFNWGDGTIYGGSKLVDNKSPMSGRGKEIQFRFEHNGIEQPVGLFGYATLVKVGRPR